MPSQYSIAAKNKNQQAEWSFRKTNYSNKVNDENRKAEVIKKANSSRTEA